MTTPIFAIDRPEVRRAHDENDSFLRVRAEEDILVAAGDLQSRIAVIGPTTRTFDSRVPYFERFDPAPLQSGDPERLLADRAWRESLGRYDVVVAIGMIERCNDPALAVGILRGMLRPGGKLIGAIVGGESLSSLRGAMIESDRTIGRAAIRIHPMIDGSGLASLLASAGLEQPVVSLDRVEVRYRDAGRLVRDLRAMGCGRRLIAPSPPITRTQWQCVERRLGAPFTERFDLLHFHATAVRA